MEKIFVGTMFLICIILLVLTYAVIRPVLIDSQVVRQTGRIVGNHQKFIQRHDSDIQRLQEDIREIKKNEKVPD